MNRWLGFVENLTTYSSISGGFDISYTDIEEDIISYHENCTIKRYVDKTDLAFSSSTVLNPPALAFIEISYTRGKAALQPSF